MLAQRGTLLGSVNGLEAGWPRRVARRNCLDGTRTVSPPSPHRAGAPIRMRPTCVVSQVQGRSIGRCRRTAYRAKEILDAAHAIEPSAGAALRRSSRPARDGRERSSPVNVRRACCPRVATASRRQNDNGSSDCSRRSKPEDHFQQAVHDERWNTTWPACRRVWAASVRDTNALVHG